MTEPRFTPAPWVWHTSNSWKRLKRECRGLSMTVLEPFVHWRDQHPDCTITEEDMALIAAAPELYAALRNLMAVASMNPSAHGNELVAFQTAMNAAQDALAKARGESV